MQDFKRLSPRALIHDIESRSESRMDELRTVMTEAESKNSTTSYSRAVKAGVAVLITSGILGAMNFDKPDPEKTSLLTEAAFYAGIQHTLYSDDLPEINSESLAAISAGATGVYKHPFQSSAPLTVFHARKAIPNNLDMGTRFALDRQTNADIRSSADRGWRILEHLGVSVDSKPIRLDLNRDTHALRSTLPRDLKEKATDALLHHYIIHHEAAHTHTGNNLIGTRLLMGRHEESVADLAAILSLANNPLQGVEQAKVLADIVAYSRATNTTRGLMHATQKNVTFLHHQLSTHPDFYASLTPDEILPMAYGLHEAADQVLAKDVAREYRQRGLQSIEILNHAIQSQTTDKLDFSRADALLDNLLEARGEDLGRNATLETSSAPTPAL